MQDRVCHVNGELVFDQDTKLFSGATAYVRFEDVSLQDAPSKVISEQIIRNVGYDPLNPQKIRFELVGDIADMQGTYAISVHIDLDGNGKINSGDFINMQSYPVLTHGYPNNIVIHLKEVR